MKLSLVRHGQTDWNIQRRYQGWEGLGLNDMGRGQAADAAGRLTDLGEQLGARWSWLASSTALRACETASIIGAALGLEPGEQVRDLIERGFGVAEGMLINEARTRWPERDYPGGEPADAVLTRSLAAVDELARAHAGVDGVVVTHGSVLRSIVGHLTGSDPGSLPNGSIAVLDGAAGSWTVEVNPSVLSAG